MPIIDRNPRRGEKNVDDAGGRRVGIIDTLRLRCDDPVKKLSGVFDALARNRDADVSALLWGAVKP